MNKKLQSGQISRTLIILAVVVLCAIVLVYFVTRMAAGNRAREEEARKQAEQAEQKEPEPVYELLVGDVQFSFQSARNIGNFISGKTASVAGQPDLTTTERFIRVTVGAQNKGLVNTAPYSWQLGNIVDSEGRNFVPIDEKAYYFLPKPDTCGQILKPEFSPTPCVKIYEVSKASTKLQLKVSAYPTNGTKPLEGMIDLIVK